MDADAVARPRFKAHVQPVVDADNGLFLLSEGGDCWIPNRVHAALAPLLDGAHDVETIFARLSEHHRSAAVFAALEDLRSRGVLAEDTADLDRPARAFWEQAGVAPGLAARRLAETPVATTGLGDVDIAGLDALLARQGLALAADALLAIVVTDDYLHPDLADLNARALAAGRSWLLVKPVGTRTWIGPAFTPGQTACWECLAHRLRWHRRIAQHAPRQNGRSGALRAPSAGLPASPDITLAEAATEIARWIGTGGRSVLADRVVATDHLTFERTHHELVRRPQCPACGSAGAGDGMAARPLALAPRAKIDGADGGHRCSDPQVVMRRLECHLSPITGIVGSIEAGERARPPAGGGDWLTPNFAADHNFSDMHDPRFALQEGMRRRSGGKGRSVHQARTSALAESLERYSGVFDGTEPRRRASFAELGDAAIHPNACMGYSDRQFAERDRHNQRGHKAHWVPEPFREDVAIEWTPLWSLSAGGTRYLPTSLCYYGYRSADPVFGRGDSNGCAAGSVPEEAVLQGLLELIERDAVALWWYNRVPRPALDLTSAGDPYVARLVEHYRGLERAIWALDLTGDFGIPVVAALSRRTDKPEEDIIYGFGCHLDPGVALSRALTELNQSLEAVPVAGQACHQHYRGGADSIDWWRTVRTADSPYLVPDPTLAPTRPSAMPALATDDIARDVGTCIERARALNIEVLALDQTRPDVGFPVVRVVAPGLRHFWARFGPGRLYDAPVRLGWLQRPLTESELNEYVIQF